MIQLRKSAEGQREAERRRTQRVAAVKVAVDRGTHISAVARKGKETRDAAKAANTVGAAAHALENPQLTTKK
jgi:hypothetical protein